MVGEIGNIFSSSQRNVEIYDKNKDGANHRMSHKEWKKLKRKQKRQAEAKNRIQEKDESESGGSDEEKKIREERERQIQHILFLEREKLAQQIFQAKKERERKEKERIEEQERKIKEEWEELQKKEAEEKERREKEDLKEKERKEALLKEATSNENKDAWHNPIAPVIYNSERPVNNCPFFKKTGACKYGDSCSRTHEYPEESNTIILPGMFTHFRLDQTLLDEYDTDLTLEYEDKDLYNSFLEFYYDVLPEFKSVGKVIQFKVCSNCSAHLRGNVYVSFERPEDAEKAIMKFNGRWYAGKQLTCEYRSIDKWKSAICGLFSQKSCPKGNICNFLHVFKNPHNEFRDADFDYQYNNYHSERRPDYRSSCQRSYQRSRSRSPRSRSRRSRSHERSRHRYRSRSRSGSVDTHRSYKDSKGSKYRSRSRYSRSPSRSNSKRHKEKKRDTYSPELSRNHSKRSRSRQKSRSKSKSKSRSKRRSRSSSSAESDSGRRKSSKHSKKSKKKKKHKKQSRSRSKTPSSILKKSIDHEDVNNKLHKLFGNVDSQKLDAVLSETLETKEI